MPLATDPEIIDGYARDEIKDLKEKQYAQSRLLEETREQCQRNSEDLATIKNEYGRRVGDIERRFTGCDAKHETALQHRRKSDQEMSIISTTLQESLEVNKKTQETLTKLLATVEKHAPTVERSSKAQTTIDGVKSFFIYVGSASAAVIVIQHFLELLNKT